MQKLHKYKELATDGIRLLLRIQYLYILIPSISHQINTVSSCYETIRQSQNHKNINLRICTDCQVDHKVPKQFTKSIEADTILTLEHSPGDIAKLFILRHDRQQQFQSGVCLVIYTESTSKGKLNPSVAFHHHHLTQMYSHPWRFL